MLTAPSSTTLHAANPIIVTVVIAPTSHNPAASSVVISLDPHPQQLASSYQPQLLPAIRAAWEKFIAHHLTDQVPASSSAARLVVEAMPQPPISVPARTYPSAAHLDLLSSPVEGLSFDPADFLEP